MRSRLLTKPSKIPGWSFSLPAGPSCPVSKLAAKLYGKRSTCHGCYAKGGNYAWPGVRAAQERRFQFVLQSLRQDGGETFVNAMVAELRRCVREPVFRIHDSGDFFNEAYVRAWIRICQAVPEIQFWAPTREWYRPNMLPVLQELAALPNVVVRPSALVVDGPPPVVEGLQAGTTVQTTKRFHAGRSVCPATRTKRKACDDHGCRTCWLPDRPVAYVAHGMMAPTMRKAARLTSTDLTP